MIRNKIYSVLVIAIVALLSGCAGCGGVYIPPTDLPRGADAGPGTPLPAVPRRQPRRVETAMPRVDGMPLSRSVYFEFDQSELTRSARAILDRHARFLLGASERALTIEGHCDERGSREYNLALGERRADVVRRYLMNAGVQGSQIEIVSYGEERPTDPGHSESSWARNRRAVLVYEAE